ncbi:hypothetical protein CU097_008428 [Rhizopus azygosporus]|uniref:Zn(2)-C6 fungal-type domain-containing protein n=1 Tax=Rhizopus azygosporus TaxID=86630 RepID=A0A367J6Z0_RHIAZ|nr:hypothetical protein CU097_008428 [Rhizopus azygosporus]
MTSLPNYISCYPPTSMDILDHRHRLYLVNGLMEKVPSSTEDLHNDEVPQADMSLGDHMIPKLGPICKAPKELPAIQHFHDYHPLQQQQSQQYQQQQDISLANDGMKDMIQHLIQRHQLFDNNVNTGILKELASLFNESPRTAHRPLQRAPQVFSGKTCQSCKKAHSGCDRMRPCGRCVRIKQCCVDAEVKKRGRPSIASRK